MYATWFRCCSFGLVVIAQAKHPIPSRTRPLSAAAPMVLRLKTWESRSPPNLMSNISNLSTMFEKKRRPSGRLFLGVYCCSQCQLCGKSYHLNLGEWQQLPSTVLKVSKVRRRIVAVSQPHRSPEAQSKPDALAFANRGATRA